MRVLYFADSMPPHMDGVVRTYCQLVETLQEESVAFQFYSPFKPGHEVTWADQVRQVPWLPLPLYTDYRVSLPQLNRLYPELDGFRPDLVHVTSPTLHGLYGLKYARRRGLPVVTSYHTHFVDYFSYYGLSKFETMGWQYLRWFYNQFDMTYVPSRSTEADLAVQGIGRTALWQRGIDLDRFSPRFRSAELRRAMGAEDLPVLLFVGRLVKEKDVDDLADAHARLQAQGHVYKLAIVGDGPAKADLMARLPDAHFAGHQSGQALSEYYASADLFLFPSTTETFGNVILEAFASGLPAIVSDKGGCQDLVTPRVNGLIAQANDPGDLADKAAFFLQSKSHINHYRLAATETATRYSWGEVNRRLLSSYDSLINA